MAKTVLVFHMFNLLMSYYHSKLYPFPSIWRKWIMNEVKPIIESVLIFHMFRCCAGF